jgi:hypothetical protein
MIFKIYQIKEQNIKDDPSKVLLDTYYLDSYLGGHSLNVILHTLRNLLS